ncbi:hypothetical protein OF83DRAFT_595155 [Amylostereum chailletii]|nr:hypothetical protein OF83DRAFT_595155 [Amylostereum chailletii]
MDLDTIKGILRYADEERAFQYVQVVGAALFTYDSLILLDDEIELVWRARWTVPKALYILSRYTPFIDLSINLYHTLASPQPDSASCHRSFLVVGWLMAIGMALSEVVMILRVYAMWERSSRILWSLSVLWVVLVVLSLYFINSAAQSFVFIHIPIPGASGCHYIVGKSYELAVSFLCMTVMESVVVILMMWAATMRWKSRYMQRSLDMTFRKLYFDGVLFFAILLILSILNILLTFLVPNNPGIALIFVVPIRVVHAMLCCRILINMRRIANNLVTLPGPIPVRHSEAFTVDTPVDELQYIDLVELSPADHDGKGTK